MRKIARLSDLIEAFINRLFDEANGAILIQRNDLANQFNCVPSQISYVIDTRFTAERGYYVESRRGGGGHICIKRININQPTNYLMHIVSSMGSSLSQQYVEIFINNFIDYSVVTNREGLLLKAATSDKIFGVVPLPVRDKMRVSILKNMLMSLLVEDNSDLMV